MDILLNEKVAYAELFQLSVQKKEILIQNDVDSLNEIIAKEREIFENIKNLENNREVIAQKIVQRLDISADKVSLEVIIVHAQGLIKQQLLKLKDELNNLIRKLTNLNDLNKDLVKTHLDFSLFSLDLMTQSGVAGETYDNSGYMKEHKKVRLGLFDQKV